MAKHYASPADTIKKLRLVLMESDSNFGQTQGVQEQIISLCLLILNLQTSPEIEGSPQCVP